MVFASRERESVVKKEIPSCWWACEGMNTNQYKYKTRFSYIVRMCPYDGPAGPSPSGALHD